MVCKHFGTFKNLKCVYCFLFPSSRDPIYPPDGNAVSLKVYEPCHSVSMTTDPGCLVSCGRVQNSDTNLIYPPCHQNQVAGFLNYLTISNTFTLRSLPEYPGQLLLTWSCKTVSQYILSIPNYGSHTSLFPWPWMCVTCRMFTCRWQQHSGLSGFGSSETVVNPRSLIVNTYLCAHLFT